MKPRIRKKGKDKNGNARHILEYESDGKIKNYALNPIKLMKILDLDYEDKNSKENNEKNGL